MTTHADNRLSSFAEAVLADHRKAPDKPFYDLDILGAASAAQRSNDWIRPTKNWKQQGWLNALGSSSDSSTT